MNTLLEKFCLAQGPSGYEGGIREVIEAAVKPYVDEVRTDTLGNLIAIRRGEGPRVMLAAHMDQIGFLVTFIDKEGFVHFTAVGGHSPLTLVNRPVCFLNGVRGVIGRTGKPIEPSKLTLNDLFIDIGAASREQAEQLVAVGDLAVPTFFFQQTGSRMTCGAMDNRVGCYVVVEALKRLKDSPLGYEVHAVFTVQEEVGCRGAGVAAYGIQPDWAVALDVTATGDVPGAAPMAVSLGKGAAIKVKDASLICHPHVKQKLVDAAQAAGAPYQMEVLTAGGTDSSAIMLVRDGIPSGVLSIPCRYIHSAVETVDEGDVEACVAVLTQLLRK